MLKYNAHLKPTARQLRKHVTDSASALWSRLRNEQLLGIQVSRQKPIGEHSVDFVTPRAQLEIPPLAPPLKKGGRGDFNRG